MNFLFSLPVIIFLYFGGLVFLFTKLKKVIAFVSMHKTSESYVIKHTRNDMIFFVLKLWGLIFITSFSSFHFLWYAAVLIWIYIIYVFSRFIVSWKFHGYSPVILISSTVLIVFLSFVTSAFLRSIILN